MAATREDISLWFHNPYVENPTHMIVVCDTYDYEDYPVYVTADLDAEALWNEMQGTNMRKCMECYSYSRSFEDQVNEHRARHFD